MIKNLSNVFALAGVALVALLLLVPVAAHADPGGPGPQQSTNPLADSRGNVAGFGGFVSGLGAGLEGGPTFGASGTFYFTRNLGVEAGFQRHSLDVVGNDGNELSGGTLDSGIAVFGIAARFPAGSRAAPYLVAGVAFFSNSFDIDPSVTAGLSDFNFTASETVDDVVGFQVGGGIDFAVAQRIALFGEARYLGATGDTVAELTDNASGTSGQVAGEQDLGRFQAVAGVRILF